MGKRKQIVLLVLLSWLFAAMRAQPQTADAQAPRLRHRTYNQDYESDSGARSSGRSLLPADVSGTYALGAGGTIDLELQPDSLGGYISRLGDQESDAGEPLTFFFAVGRLSGQRLAFSTRQVHGVWFSFDGTIVRGPAQDRAQPGFYLLQGKLVMHDATRQTEQARMVSLPRNR